MIEKPVITGFTIESAVLDQPPVLLPGAETVPRYLVANRIKIVLERFGPERIWGAREVWVYGQVAGESWEDSLVWRDLARPGHEPKPVEHSLSMPHWVAAFVQERLTVTT